MDNILQWLPLVKEIAPIYDLSVPLVLAIIWIESSGNPDAYNTKSGATGLMQVIPKEHSPESWGRPTIEELFDPKTNIEWGCKILRYFWRVEGQDIKRAAYRYSGGIYWLQRSDEKERKEFEGMHKLLAFNKFLEGYWNPLAKKQAEIEKLINNGNSEKVRHPR